MHASYPSIVASSASEGESDSEDELLKVTQALHRMNDLDSESESDDDIDRLSTGLPVPVPLPVARERMSKRYCRPVLCLSLIDAQD